LLSYAVSYLFIAIVWTNHHYLMRYATRRRRACCGSFRASVLDVAAAAFHAWMAVSELAPQRSRSMAAVFFLVNATYVALIWDLIDRTPGTTIRHRGAPGHADTLADHAMLLRHRCDGRVEIPLAGLGISICCLIVYLKPSRRCRERGCDRQGISREHDFSAVARMSVSDIWDNSNTAPDFADVIRLRGRAMAAAAYAITRFSRILRKSVARLP